MAITRSVRQQYENYIAVKNGVKQESMSLMFVAPISEVEGDKGAAIVRGSVVSLNTNGKMVLGLTEGTGNVYPMPMFAKKNAFDPDVTTGAIGASTGEILASSTVGGRMTAYVATGAFELETSEFDTAATYGYNVALVADANGKVTPATGSVYGDKTVVGIVSATPFRSKASMNVNGTGSNRLCFWPVFFPPTRATAGETADE